MTVRIYLDLDKLHLVANGLRHRARLSRVPDPGNQVTTLCGRVEKVEYTSKPEGTPVKTCWRCDFLYRRGLGFAIPPTHPGFKTSAQPSRKRPYTN